MRPERPENSLRSHKFKYHKFLPGHLGGEQQMGAQIENNDIDLVIFLRRPAVTEVPRAGCPTRL